MKIIKRLNIQDKPSYFFKYMTNIDDIEPECFIADEFTIIKDGSIVFDVVYNEEDNVTYIVFNNIVCIFRKSENFSYLFFCENDKNKGMLNNYAGIIDQLKEEILYILENVKNIQDELILGKYFMRFRFKTDDNLPYNKKLMLKFV